MKYAFLYGLIFLAACSEPPRPARTTGHTGMPDDTVVKYNHGVVLAERQEIDDFISRYHWVMNTSPSGLRWMITREGKGLTPQKDDTVSIRYSVSSITGDPIYRSDSMALLEFRTGTARVPNGLEEGIMLMRTGSRARLIVPSHLAFGLLGDMDRIASRQTLVYDVELCMVRHGKH